MARHRWYNLALWQRIRAAQLAVEPLCVHCKANGIITVGNHIDHIVDHTGDWARFVDRANLQTLCASCHSKKTHPTNTRPKIGEDGYPV